MTLTVEDDAGNRDSTSQDVTVAADTDDATTTTVTVSDLAYSTQGRWHLRVTATVVDDGGAPVEGASVALTIEDAEGNHQSGTATTGEDGAAIVQFNHALRDADCYTTTIDSVTGDGIDWDEAYPTGTGSCG